MDAVETYTTSPIPDTELEEGEEILIQGFGKNDLLWLSNYRVMQWSAKSLLKRTAKLGQIPLESMILLLADISQMDSSAFINAPYWGRKTVLPLADGVNCHPECSI